MGNPESCQLDTRRSLRSDLNIHVFPFLESNGAKLASPTCLKTKIAAIQTIDYHGKYKANAEVAICNIPEWQGRGNSDSSLDQKHSTC